MGEQSLNIAEADEGDFRMGMPDHLTSLIQQHCHFLSGQHNVHHGDGQLRLQQMRVITAGHDYARMSGKVGPDLLHHVV